VGHPAFSAKNAEKDGGTRSVGGAMRGCASPLLGLTSPKAARHHRVLLGISRKA
jgi:hypothetical protein